MGSTEGCRGGCRQVERRDGEVSGVSDRNNSRQTTRCPSCVVIAP